MGIVQRANDRAQRRFRAALTAYFRHGTWETHETRLYTQGERLAEELEVQSDWERAKAEMDALQAADHDYHELTGELQPRTCETCNEYSEEPAARYYTETEARYAYGDR